MPALQRFPPFRDLDLVERRMRRLFPEFSAPFFAPLAPAADVYETGGALVFELEVPGYEEKELDVEVSDHTLTIKGAREEEIAKEEKTLRLHERLESTFERRFELPADTDVEHMRATYRKGVLTLHVPKAPQLTPRKIEIANN